MTTLEPTGPTPQLVPLAELRLSDWNPRSITDPGLDSLARSIAADPNFMWLRPILARENGEIYAGHQRYKAIVKLGWTAVPAIIEDVDEATAKERALKDNNSWGEWQDDGLATLLASMQGTGVEMLDLGFSQREMDRYLSMVDQEPPAGEDDADLTPPAEPITKTGDLVDSRRAPLVVRGFDERRGRRAIDGWRESGAAGHGSAVLGGLHSGEPPAI